jgi:hypothetical protein
MIPCAALGHVCGSTFAALGDRGRYFLERARTFQNAAWTARAPSATKSGNSSTVPSPSIGRPVIIVRLRHLPDEPASDLSQGPCDAEPLLRHHLGPVAALGKGQEPAAPEAEPNPGGSVDPLLAAEAVAFSSPSALVPKAKRSESRDKQKYAWCGSLRNDVCSPNAPA